MALLTNVDILQIISNDVSNEGVDKLIISPYDSEGITPVGYDLRIGDSYVIGGEEKSLSAGGEVKIIPRGIALVRTLEEIRMPKNKMLSGIITSKVSLSCRGISNISTTVDADWKGCLLIAIHNNSSKEIILKHGDQFCTILFLENKSAAKDGKYAKPHKRTDILTEAFKKNTKNAPILTFFVNCIPPLFAVVSLFVAGKFFSGEAYMISASVAVGVFLSTYVTKFVDPLIGYLKR